MPLYRVKPGYEHGARGQYKAGNVVEHTAIEAAGFLDKLELVQPAAPVAPPEAPRFVVAEATVAEVIQAVTAGDLPVADALAQERAGRRRKSLLEALVALPTSEAG